MGDEGWAEWAATDPALVRALYRDAPERMQQALDVVRRAAPGRLTYAAVEQRLDWPRGRLGRVIGGWRSRLGDSKRPYRICPPELSRSGEWEIWMDAEQAEALR